MKIIFKPELPRLGIGKLFFDYYNAIKTRKSVGEVLIDEERDIGRACVLVLSDDEVDALDDGTIYEMFQDAVWIYNNKKDD